MKLIFVIQFLLLSFFGISVESASCYSPFSNMNLELVQVVFRHGERTPQSNEVKLLPKSDLNLAGPWGFSQLTNVGKYQEYRIGEMLRQRYGDFLGEAYRPEDVYGCSSAFDRTKSSLLLVLAALYTPTVELTWNEDLDWLPIPIHFVPKELDVLFNFDSCPKFQKAWRDLMNSKEIKNRLLQYQDLFKFMNKVYPHIKFDLEQLFYLNSVLNAMKTQNVEMPDWYTPEIHSRIIAASKLYLDTLSYTRKLRRLNAGGLTRRIVENMDIDWTRRNPRKIYLYSGHEFTVYALAKAHNVTLAKSPPFGSALIIEKLRNDQGELFVKMLYWTGPSEELVPIKLDNCDEYCSIEDYVTLINPSIPSDEEMRCLFKNLTPTDLENILTSDVQTIST